MPDISTIEFLQALYREPVGPGRLLVWTFSRRSGKKHSYWINNLDEAARQAQRLRSSRDVYFGVALQDPKRAKAITRRRRPRVRKGSVRGAEDAAMALPALFADFGAAGMPADRRDALRLFEELRPRASIVVDSGGGYHLYWLLREPWLLDTADHRERAKDLLRRVQGVVRAAARDRGWPTAVGGDLARALRLPGTFNRKTAPPRLVSVETFPEADDPGGAHRYAPADFAALPEADSEAADAQFHEARLPGAGIPGEIDADPPVDFRAMYQGCAFLRHCYVDRRVLSEDEWRIALKLALESTWGGHDGRQLGRFISADHPGYTPRGTDEELDVLQDAPAPTCPAIDRATQGAYCRRCPSRGRIETPLDLGRPDPDRPPNAELLLAMDAAEGTTAGSAGIPPAESATPAGCAGVASAGRAAVPAAGSAGVSPARADTVAAVCGPTRHSADVAQILLSPREHEVTDHALAALAAREPNLYQRAGALVHLVPSRCAAESAAPALRTVSGARIRELLTRHCALLTPHGEEPREVHPPRWLVSGLLSRATWPQVPALEGVVECPVLRPDGSVLQQAGYDPASGLLLAPAVAFEPVPDAPTRARAGEAWSRLAEAVCNFPFKTLAHRSAWLASLLTPLARAAFDGPAPLNLIDANVSGAGKTLLADVVAVLLTGRTAPRMSYSGNEEELRKAITGVALEATQMVLMDNVSGTFGSPTLDRALTAGTWRDRLLGGNAQVSLPLRMTWFATGNNVMLAGDTPRRCLHIRLQSSFERPERRSGFAHPRLLAWLRRERPRLLPAALTLLRAYVAAGRPDQGLASWGSYEGWSDLVRGCVVWLGLPDPADTREDLAAAADTERGVVHDLVHGLARLLAKNDGAATASEIVDRLARSGDGRYTLLRSALAELFPRLPPGQLPTALRLAGRLRAYRGRVVRGACIDHESQGYKGVRWTVRRMGGDPKHEEGGSHDR